MVPVVLASAGIAGIAAFAGATPEMTELVTRSDHSTHKETKLLVTVLYCVLFTTAKTFHLEYPRVALHPWEPLQPSWISFPPVLPL